jgi:hypothetical protein
MLFAFGSVSKEVLAIFAVRHAANIIDWISSSLRHPPTRLHQYSLRVTDPSQQRAIRNLAHLSMNRVQLRPAVGSQNPQQCLDTGATPSYVRNEK